MACLSQWQVTCPESGVPLNCILYENLTWEVVVLHSAEARHLTLPTGTKETGFTAKLLPEDLLFTSCLIFFSKGGPFSWNSVTIPDSSDSCLITSCRSSTRWDGAWGLKKEWVCLHQRKISVWTNKPTKRKSFAKTY